MGPAPLVPRASGAVPAWLLRQYRHNPAPLLLLGGGAAARAEVARTFWQNGPLRGGPLVELACGRDEERLRRALEDWLTGGHGDPRVTSLRAAERGTLYLDGIEALGDGTQRLLLAFLQRFLSPAGGDAAEWWAGRLVAGASERLLRAVDHGWFSARLFDALDKIRVDLGGDERQGAA